MGSGKSTVGRELAKILACEFIDLDHKIEEQQGKSVAAIFETERENAFRLYEHQLLAKILENNERIVIACGGGAPCFHHNMDLLTRHSITVYLQASVKELFENLRAQTAHRPLLKSKSPEELREYIERTLEARESVYRQAQIIIDTQDKTLEEIVCSISQQIASTQSPPAV